MAKKLSKKKRGQGLLTDARLGSEARRDRRSDDRELTQDRVLTDDERLQEFRQTLFQSVLPDLPKIPGYHTIWLTTSNPADSIARRVRLGYEPLRAEDHPGWEHASLKTGEYVGCIGVNEMVAFKLPLPLYEAYMREMHHDQPLLEEEKLTSVIEVIENEAAQVAKRGKKGIKIETEEGWDDLAEARDAPVFAEETGEV